MKKIFQACAIAGGISAAFALYSTFGLVGGSNMLLTAGKSFLMAGIITYVAIATTYGQ